MLGCNQKYNENSGETWLLTTILKPTLTMCQDLKIKSIITTAICFLSPYQKNCIRGVMVSVLASSAVDRRFEPRSDQDKKDNKIGIGYFLFSTQKEQTGWIGIRIMCPSGAKCLSVESCFS
jgi:hypothetical protein